MSEVQESPPPTPESNVTSSLSWLTLIDSAASPATRESDSSQMKFVSVDSRTPLCSAAYTISLDTPLPNAAFFRALSFLLQYEQTRDTTHLEAAIKQYRVLLQVTPVEHADYLGFQSFLCDALCEQFDLWGDLAVIEEAVELGDAVNSASYASHPDHWHHLCCAAKSRMLRYDILSQESDVTRAVELVEIAKSGMEHEDADEACILMTRGEAYFLYFESRNDLQSLQQATASLSAALGFLSEASSARAACLLYLSKCHGRSHGHMNNVHDLSKWMFTAQSALNLTSCGDPRLARTLSILSVAMREEWEAHGDPQRLDEAVIHSKSALRCLLPGDRKLGVCLGTHATGLSRRYELLGDMDDLNESVRFHETALGMIGKREHNYCSRLGNYCYIMWVRFRATGRLQDLDTSILKMQGLLADRTTPEYSHKHIRRTLGMLVYERYALLGRLPDLLWAVQIVVESTTNQPTSGEELFNAGEAYHRLYQRTRDVAHLSAAIRYFETAEGTTRSVHIADQCTAFGTALVSRAHLSTHTSDWDRAVLQLRLAVHHAPSGHLRRPEALRMLASGLRKRFEALSTSDDIRESISILSDFLAHAAAYERARVRFALGESMASYFHSFRDGAYLDLALKKFQSAATDVEGFISERFNAALKLATLAQTNAYRRSAHIGYCLAVQLLPRVAWVGFGKHIRLEQLQKQAATLAVDAAAAAIDIGEYESATELLESGRGILWSQLLQLRTDVDDIHEVAPSLATELHEVGRALQMEVGGSGGLDRERLLQRQRRLAERWEQLLEEVRKVDGFQTFLTSAQFSDLLPSAEAGPIVIFNASESRCDAIIVSAKVPAYHCPLPAMRMDYALLLSKFLRQALRVSKDRQGREFLDSAVSNVLDRLWTNVGALVWDALKALYPTGVPRRIWFCPTGPFCLLPLHAAKPTDGPGFPDLFICSYTATLSSLIRARADREHAGQIVEAPNMLAVSQPATPGYDPLLCAIDEMQIIYDSDLGATTTFLNGSDATVATVCEEMLENAWVHFSCHGSSNTVNPLETCFRFHDGPLNLSRISELRLPHADFAFLSACHTARAFGNLPDEALHLAAGLQLAGFKSVIGTQWSIADIDAPEVAKIVYEYMTQEGRYDHRSAAEGLHKAVNTLRSRGVASWRWVPFIHLGV